MESNLTMSEITREERARLLRVQLGFLRDAEMRVRNAGRDVPDDLEAAIVATTLALAKISNHPKCVRNEAARCGNCPYSVTFGSAKVLCRFEHASAEHGFPVREDTEVCGDHPDFWR